MTAHSHKAGMALLASLLLLGLLLTLAVMFLGVSRFERITVNAQSGIEQSRLALQTGYALALRQIAESYGEGSNALVYAAPPLESTWHSGGTGGSVSNLLPEGIQPWLPGRLRGTGSGSAEDLAASAQWIVLGETDAVHSATAYVAFDLSGLLDPNHTGRTTNRADFILWPDSISTYTLGFDRSDTNLYNPDRFYTTPAEFAFEHPSVDPVFAPLSVSYDTLRWSWYEPGETNGTYHRETVLPGQDVSRWPERWTVSDATNVYFHLYGDTNRALDMAYAHLDFWDTDRVPLDPWRLCGEAVPMFNEVLVELVVSNHGDRVSVDLAAGFELWYPFPAQALEGDVRLGGVPGFSDRSSGDPLPLILSTVTNTVSFSPAPSDVTNAFALLRADAGDPSFPAAEGGTIAMDLDLSALTLVWSNQVIDVFPSNAVVVLPEVLVPPSGSVARVEAFLEVSDPRSNHRWDQWQSSSNATPLEVNAASLAAITANPDLVDPFACWVPGDTTAPLDAAWLGFLPTGEPWQSIDLFSGAGRWLLQRVHTERRFLPPDNWTFGLVNPNNLETGVLASVFLDAPVMPLPFLTSTNVGLDLALELEEALHLPLQAGIGFLHLADWTWAVEDLLMDRLGDRHAAESVVANTYALLETAQQRWLVVLAGQTRAAGGQGILSETRAVALVYWNPLRDESGRHESRRLLWLEMPAPPRFR